MRKKHTVDALRFETFFTEHLSAVARFAERRSTGSGAGDVVCETFAVAWRRFDDIPDAPMDRAWLFGVARRLLANQRRGNTRRAALSDRLEQQWRTESSALSGPADVPAVLAIRETFGALSSSDSELLTLAAWEELTPAEIAVVLGLKPEVVRNRLSRARRRFADAYQGIDDQKADPTTQAGNLGGKAT